MIEFTPGPWRTQLTTDGQAVRIFADSVYLGSICNTDFTVSQSFTNATLMAAAPDLLAALIFAKQMMIANDLDLPNTFEVIDEAIAKAKGETK